MRGRIGMGMVVLLGLMAGSLAAQEGPFAGIQPGKDRPGADRGRRAVRRSAGSCG